MKRQSEAGQFAPTERTTVRRGARRANYDRETIHRILDAGLVCQVGFVVDGRAAVIPTAYGRIDDVLYLHGSPASRMLRALQSGIDVCVTVTLVDGLVLARSAFHHSMNYRSVVIYGQAAVVSDPREKLAALRAFVEHITPGRWPEVREPNPGELAGTLVLALPLVEVSAKVRTGPPVDDEADLDWPVWAGVIPLETRASAPIRDPLLAETIATPAYALEYTRPLRPE